MSDDWQVGDLAVCIENDPCPCCGDPSCLEIGGIYTVRDLYVDPTWDGALFLKIAELPPIAGRHHDDLSWCDAESFRKFSPPPHEACEAEFITLLKRSKRRVEA